MRLQIFITLRIVDQSMGQRLRYMIILAVCIILCNQFVHLYLLYKERKAEYIHWQNGTITGAIYEFNLKYVNHNNVLSYNTLKNELILGVNNKITHFQLSEEDNIRKITERSRYDIRDLQSWNLKNFYTYLQAKQNSAQMKNLHMQFVIQDSFGQIKDSYPTHFESLPLSPEYQEPLGFISADTLYATYNYPLIVFIQATLWEIILTIIISTLFIICIVNLYQTIRNEKKSGEYRELFIHNLVHDLKRPIANQIKICYLLQKAHPERSSSFEQSRKQLNEMLESINRMLFQSTDAHGLRLNVKEINLRELLDTLTQKDRWHTETNKQFDIQVDFRSVNPKITGDYDFLFAVFENFIDNALKYSGDQTNIRITCTDPDAEFVLIRIEDNGFGISADSLKHVFERYHRGDQQGNGVIKGHGQGLHYARTVILAHGGKIDIESEKGKGTTILVSLRRNAKVKNKYRH